MARIADITVTPTSLATGPDRKGKFVVTITNVARRSFTARVDVKAEGTTRSDWIKTNVDRFEIGTDKTQSIEVSFEAPPEAAVGRYGFHIQIVDVGNPDEFYENSQSVSVDLPPGRVGPGWWATHRWQVLAIAAGVVAIGAIATAVMSRNHDDGPVQGTGGQGTGGQGTGGSFATLTISGQDFGAFDNAFVIAPCTGTRGGGVDCPNLPVDSPTCPTTPWRSSGEATGNTLMEAFTVSGGDPTKVYAVTVRVRGQVEGRAYTDGSRAMSTDVDPNAVNNLLYTGGRPGRTRPDYNVYSMEIAPAPGSPPIPGGASFYAFNAVDAAHEGQHYNFEVDETFTFRVKSGFTVTLTSHDSNCIMIMNCGPGGPYNFASPTACRAAARTVAGVTLPATFRGRALENGGAQPFQAQFLNFKVLGVAAE